MDPPPLLLLADGSKEIYVNLVHQNCLLTNFSSSANKHQTMHYASSPAVAHGEVSPILLNPLHSNPNTSVFCVKYSRATLSSVSELISFQCAPWCTTTDCSNDSSRASPLNRNPRHFVFPGAVRNAVAIPTMSTPWEMLSALSLMQSNALKTTFKFAGASRSNSIANK